VAALQPGVSMAAVVLSPGLNANLMRLWVREAEAGCDGGWWSRARPERRPAVRRSARRYTLHPLTSL